MKTNDTFPLGLLKQSAEARKKYFRDYWVAHTKIKEAADELLELIHEPADAEVINLIGPTGVGKTTLMQYVIKVLYEEALSDLIKNPGKIPAAYMTAANPETGSYDWKEHYVSTLIALNEPLINKKKYLPDPGASYDEIKTSLEERIGGRKALRRAAQSALYNRIMFAFFVDEAQFITKRKSGDGLMNQADTLRSIAAASEKLHVLVGTYDLRHLRNLNGQLGRRSHTVHFSSYKIDGVSNSGVKDIESFTEAFLSFQAHLPLAKMPDLTKHLEFCFLRCLGCIGLLKSWFRRGLAMSLEETSGALNSKLFLKAAPPKAVCEQIAQEIKDGEEALEDSDEELIAELGKIEAMNNKESMKSVKKQSNGSHKKVEGSTKSSKKAKKSKGRPFKPAPKRYPVGTQEDAN